MNENEFKDFVMVVCENHDCEFHNWEPYGHVHCSLKSIEITQSGSCENYLHSKSRRDIEIKYYQSKKK